MPHLESDSGAASRPGKRLGGGPVYVWAGKLEDRDAYIEEVFWVPESARWSALLVVASCADIARRIDDALSAIERENPGLCNVLPRIYTCVTTGFRACPRRLPTYRASANSPQYFPVLMKACSRRPSVSALAIVAPSLSSSSAHTAAINSRTRGLGIASHVRASSSRPPLFGR